MTEGRLLPRSREEIAARIGSLRRRGRRRARGRLCRSGAAEPAGGRGALAGRGRRRALVRDRPTPGARAREACARVRLRTLTAFTHTPGYFVQLGFSIVPHTWLPEKIEADCRTCAQFRHCGQYAVMLPLIRMQASRVPARLHTCLRPSTVRDLTITPTEGRRHRAERLSLGGAALRDQGQSQRARSRPSLPPTRPPRRPDSSRRTSRRPRRCWSRSGISRARGGVARAIVVNSGCANACTGDQGMSRCRAHGRGGGRGAGVRSERRARRIDRRDRRQSQDGRVVTRHQRCRRRARPRQGQRDRARHHDDGSVSEGIRGHGPDRRADRLRSAARRRARA